MGGEPPAYFNSVQRPSRLLAHEPGTGTGSPPCSSGPHTSRTATLQVQTTHVGFSPHVTEEEGATQRPCKVTQPRLDVRRRSPVTPPSSGTQLGRMWTWGWHYKGPLRPCGPPPPAQESPGHWAQRHHRPLLAYVPSSCTTPILQDSPRPFGRPHRNNAVFPRSLGAGLP